MSSNSQTIASLHVNSSFLFVHPSFHFSLMLYYFIIIINRVKYESIGLCEDSRLNKWSEANISILKHKGFIASRPHRLHVNVAECSVP